jgi:hypothetical protein
MAIRVSGMSVAAVGGVLMVLAAAGTIVYGLLGARPVVIERGALGTGQAWQLVASEQADGLRLSLDGASMSQVYSSAEAFSDRPSRGYWAGGPGPGDSTFYYGPAPTTAQYAVFSAPGRRPLVVPTRPIPNSIGLPSGRFFIVCTRGRGNVTWRVTLKDADGHVVPFASF